MGVFPFEVVLRDILFNKSYGPKMRIWNFSGVKLISAGVNDPTEIILAGSMTPLKFRNKFLNFFTIL
jgi:hypothetical protein